MRTWFRESALVLALAAGLGLALAAVDRALAPRIAAHARARLEAAVLEVVPGGVRFAERELDASVVYEVTGAGGSTVGWAAAIRARGFQDAIRLLVGLDAAGERIVGLAVLESRETPGLGERIREPAFRDRFTGLPAGGPIDVDAITGATVSSEAVIRAVEDEVERVAGAIRRELVRRGSP